MVVISISDIIGIICCVMGVIVVFGAWLIYKIATWHEKMEEKKIDEMESE